MALLPEKGRNLAYSELLSRSFKERVRSELKRTPNREVGRVIVATNALVHADRLRVRRALNVARTRARHNNIRIRRGLGGNQTNQFNELVKMVGEKRITRYIAELAIGQLRPKARKRPKNTPAPVAPIEVETSLTLD